ncbi:MAG: hypothetical protein GJT30_11005 [Geobacter sp.]|nr:hypothetical protein [Geobacter sp.]
MKSRLNLKSGQKGTKALVERYGESLLYVRYRYDEARGTELEGRMMTDAVKEGRIIERCKAVKYKYLKGVPYYSLIHHKTQRRISFEYSKDDW